MNKFTTLQICAFGLVASLALAASAHASGAMQDSATQASEATAETQENVATVRTDSGVIMLSHDEGPFVGVSPELPAASGDRLMVSRDSIATVVYNDGCEQKYDDAGIYEISPNCVRAAALYTNTAPRVWSTGAVTLAALGGAGVGALIQKQNCDCRCPPVSR